jgi:general L-amino acid transport system permease protein
MASSCSNSLPAAPGPAPQPLPIWRRRSVRLALFQALVVAAIVALIAWLALTTAQHMRARGIQSGYDFLPQPANFSIGESLVPFDSSESYGKAILVGLSNTIRVSLPAILLATLLGALIGVGRLSSNWLMRTVCRVYVDGFRNIPLLLQLFMWYFALTELLPPVDEALRVMPDVFLSNSGLQFPILAWRAGHGFALDVPEKTMIAIMGGGTVTPEYLTVLLGLVTYTASYIAEVVRGGILSVPHGQFEACHALGLSRRQGLRLVRMPQALRAIVPPLTSQYLSLIKNSSLAVAVGYPDLVSVSNTTMNQTGRAVECIAVVMACYLILSLLTSLAMSVYNRRAQAWGG